MVAGQKRKQPESLTLELVKAGISEKLDELQQQLAASHKRYKAYTAQTMDQIASASQARFELCLEHQDMGAKLRDNAKKKSAKNEAAVAVMAQGLLDSFSQDNPRKQLEALKKSIAQELARLGSKPGQQA